LKGGSAFWINKQSGLFSSHFSWAQEYFAGSVSKDKLPMVEAYILQQETHHKTHSFQEEYNQFMKHFIKQ
jgi:REP element-mobilizing transposase RayT